MLSDAILKCINSPWSYLVNSQSLSIPGVQNSVVFPPLPKGNMWFLKHLEYVRLAYPIRRKKEDANLFPCETSQTICIV